MRLGDRCCARGVFNYVRLADHSTTSGARNPGQVDALVGGKASRARRRTHRFRRWCRCRRRCCRPHRRRCGCWRWRWRCRSRLRRRRLRRGWCRSFPRCCLVEFTEQRPEGHDVTFLHRAPDEYAAGCRGHLDRYLIRFQLDHGFAGGHRFAFLLEPTGDGGFYDRLAERRNLDRDHALKCVMSWRARAVQGADRRR